MRSTFMEKAGAAAGRKAQPASKQDPHHAALSNLERQVFRLHSEIEKYIKLVDQLGSQKDTVTLRASISVKKDEVQSKAKEIKEQFSQMNRNKQDMEMKQQERLKKSVERFTQYLDEYQKALKLCADREIASPPIMVSSTSTSTARNKYDESEELLKRQQQQEVERLDNMITYNEAIIDERDQEIQGLVRDIGELNEMFQDVAVMVHDQGTMIDNVETNALVTADRVQAGRTELEQAEKSQQSATSKKMCLAVISGCVAGTIAAILIFMA